MAEPTDYDCGYASAAAGGLVWTPPVILLHLSWVCAQLARSPKDEFKWGRYDALCDLLVACGPLPEQVPVARAAAAGGGPPRR